MGGEEEGFVVGLEEAVGLGLYRVSRVEGSRGKGAEGRTMLRPLMRVSWMDGWTATGGGWRGGWLTAR